MELSVRSCGRKDDEGRAAARSSHRSNGDSPARFAKETADCLRPTKATDVFWRGLFGAGYGGSSYVVEVDFFDFVAWRKSRSRPPVSCWMMVPSSRPPWRYTV